MAARTDPDYPDIEAGESRISSAGQQSSQFARNIATPDDEKFHAVVSRQSTGSGVRSQGAGAGCEARSRMLAGAVVAGLAGPRLNKRMRRSLESMKHI